MSFRWLGAVIQSDFKFLTSAAKARAKAEKPYRRDERRRDAEVRRENQRKLLWSPLRISASLRLCGELWFLPLPVQTGLIGAVDNGFITGVIGIASGAATGSIGDAIDSVSQ